MVNTENRLRGFEAAAKTLDKAIRNTREYVAAAEADKYPTLGILKARLSSLIFARALLAMGEFPDEPGNRQQIEKALRKTNAQ